VPRFGELQPTDVWSAASRTLTDYSGVWTVASRTLTDFSAEEIFDLPRFDDLYGATAPTSSATANAFGAWTEMIANVGTGKRLLYLALTPDDAGTGSINYQIEVGEGTAGNEVAVARYQGRVRRGASDDERGERIIPLWKSLTDNARISVRLKDSEAAARIYRVTPQIA